MPEPTRFKFTFQELAALMARQLDLKEGLWGLQVGFGIAAANVGPDPDEISPAAIVPIVEIGLQQYATPSRLTVDAARIDEVLSKPSSRETKASRTRRKNSDAS